MENNGFLPISKKEMTDLGWYYYDFLLITGDAYVDHPSFGAAVISRVLEDKGYRVAILSQPQNKVDLEKMGKPRLATLITAGNIDSMVAHYSVAKKRRAKDSYTAGGKAGKRPDMATIVYTQYSREAFGDTPVILGGLEASLRRFAHYDYWKDEVLPSILVQSGADMLCFGMSETSIVEIANRLKRKKKPSDMTDIRGTAFLTDAPPTGDDVISVPSFDKITAEKRQYAKFANMVQQEQDHVRGHIIIQEQEEGVYLVQQKPSIPLETEELDKVYALPYMRYYHPSYEERGGVAAIEEVEHSIIHNRGCFGSCNFCALALHQGRYVTSRSHESVLEEAHKIVNGPRFKGYIHDVGGPTANFRRPACKKQKKLGTCKDRQCLYPTPCPNLDADENDYLKLLTEIREIKGVKKVFVRSGIRFDYMLADKKSQFFSELVKHHISGQLKVAPEHISPNVLYYMGKPNVETYEKFCEQYKKLNEKHGKNQFLVPYLMSSHPGSDLKDAITLALYLKKNKVVPEQVQDFYPTPGTLSTAMYYTGIDPRTMKPVFVEKSAEGKAMQRALLQPRNPKNRALVVKALKKAKREDLIGKGGLL